MTIKIKYFTHILIVLGLGTCLSCGLPEVDDPVDGCPNQPKAEFSPDKTSGNAPLTVSFSNTTSGVNNYFWDFGDGNLSIATSPQHTFTIAGVYSVKLFATSQANCKDSITVNITVNTSGPAPISAFDVINGDCYASCQVVFSNKSTNAIAYEWDFGDGSPKVTEIGPTHTYETPGTYTVVLKAFGPGGEDTLSKPVSIKAITFKKTFGGVGTDYGNSVVQTSDGGYIIAGETNSEGAGGSDVYVIKANNEGDLERKMTFGGIAADVGYSVKQTTDGQYIIAGFTQSFTNGSNDIYLIKADNSLNPVWTQHYGGISVDNGFDIIETSDGNYVPVGISNSTGYKVWLTKVDKGSGVLVWPQLIFDVVENEANAIQQTSDGGFIIAGTAYNPANNNSKDLYLLKINSAGVKVWSNFYGGIREDHGHSVIQTNDGGYVVVGSYKTGQPGPEEDLYLVKTDGNGNMEYDQKFGGIEREKGYSVQQTTDGGFIIVGYTDSDTNGNRDVYLVKTNSAGNKIWERKFGGTNDEEGKCVQQTADGGFIIVGFQDTGTSRDVYLIKTDKNGNVL